ncbi:hypothetical protein JRO89_XS07G0113900 [Xanthoceras sorbifolium]|uniref:DUF4219 domain-containing protein n=1 Tax=Xanthoceras sorbifolium TaxID=99658 RepID=A0ABQ8HTK4_9ROSI|nr:hypothetical protein JRO89_XS07G0113900 [Xanthoceras sorbifolium]
MVDSSRSSIPLLIFHGENYDFWFIKMMTYFRSQNLWKIIEEGFNIPEETSTLSANQKKVLEEYQQKDSQALFSLQQAMADETFPRIMGASTAKEAWDTYCRRSFKERKSNEGTCGQVMTMAQKTGALPLPWIEDPSPEKHDERSSNNK